MTPICVRYTVRHIADQEHEIRHTAGGVAAIPPLTSRPDSLAQIVYDAIKAAIVGQLIPPGSPVSEADLARQLRVSKTPVREALLRLQTVGLVEPSGQRGARVVVPSEELLRHAYEVRATLEAGVARLAAEHGTEEQRAVINDAARRSMDYAEAEDIPGFQQWDERFHHLAAEACGNRRLIELVENAATLARVLRERDAPTRGDALRCAQYHLDIAAAIGHGDSQGAATTAFDHVEFVRQIVVSARKTKEPAAHVTRTADDDFTSTRAGSAGDNRALRSTYAVEPLVRR